MINNTLSNRVQRDRSRTPQYTHKKLFNCPMCRYNVTNINVSYTKSRCCICLTDQNNIAIFTLPCNHKDCLCIKCFAKLINYSKTLKYEKFKDVLDTLKWDEYINNILYNSIYYNQWFIIILKRVNNYEKLKLTYKELCNLMHPDFIDTNNEILDFIDSDSSSSTLNMIEDTSLDFYNFKLMDNIYNKLLLKYKV